MPYALIRDGRLVRYAPEPPAAADGERCEIVPIGCAWSDTAGGFVDAPTYVWDGAAYVEDAALVEAVLVRAVKVEAERRKMQVASEGGAKKAEYAAKRAEILAWDGLAATGAARVVAFDVMPEATRSRRFEYLIADAAAFGDTPAAAVARFRAGMTKASSAARIAATEARTCAAIRAAATAAAKRAAAASANWASAPAQ